MLRLTFIGFLDRESTRKGNVNFLILLAGIKFFEKVY